MFDNNLHITFDLSPAGGLRFPKKPFVPNDESRVFYGEKMELQTNYTIDQVRKYFKDRGQFNALFKIPIIRETLEPAEWDSFISIYNLYTDHRKAKGKTPLIPPDSTYFAFCIEDLYDVLEVNQLYDVFMELIREYDRYKDTFKSDPKQEKPDPYYTEAESKFCETDFDKVE